MAHRGGGQVQNLREPVQLGMSDPDADQGDVGTELVRPLQEAIQHGSELDPVLDIPVRQDRYGGRQEAKRSQGAQVPEHQTVAEGVRSRHPDIAGVLPAVPWLRCSAKPVIERSRSVLPKIIARATSSGVAGR